MGGPLVNDTNISKDPGLRLLIERFPRLFRGAQPAVWSHVPAGWTAIVESLFNGIDTLLILVSVQDDTNHGMLCVVKDDWRNAWQDLDR